MARSEFGSKPSQSLGVFFAKPKFGSKSVHTKAHYEQGPVEVLVEQGPVKGLVVFELCNLL